MVDAASLPEAWMRAVELRRAPRRRGVADGAICVESPRVEAGVLMARNAGGSQSLELSTRVAFGTGHSCMCTGERELRLVVVKGNIVPACGFVTRRTVRAKLPTMRVVLFMARAAVCRGAFEHAVYVTLRAGNTGVGAGQREGCQIVVEGRGFPPGGRVAGGAIAAKLTRVGIVLLVAGVTVLRSRGEIRQCQGTAMALVAGNAGVLPRQREGEAAVIEGLAEPVQPIVTA